MEVSAPPLLQQSDPKFAQETPLTVGAPHR